MVKVGDHVVIKDEPAHGEYARCCGFELDKVFEVVRPSDYIDGVWYLEGSNTGIHEDRLTLCGPNPW